MMLWAFLVLVLLLTADGALAQSGLSADEVRQAQRHLASAGYEPGEADGSETDKTAEAVRQYQADWRLNVTGTLSHELLARLARKHETTAPRWQKAENQDCLIWNKAPGALATGTWTGTCKDGRASGRGETVWRYIHRGEEKSTSYEGARRDGKRHGRGIAITAGNSRYEGEFRNGEYHGRGVYAWADGDRHEGEWRDGKRHGRGVYAWADGDRYEGEWRDGKHHGRGIWTVANGDRYEGEFRDDRRTGRGVYAWANGNRYEGDFVDGVMSGEGVFLFTGGNRYEGAFRNNRPHGQGAFTRKDGTTYRGTWRDGCFRDGDKTSWLGTTKEACGF